MDPVKKTFCKVTMVVLCLFLSVTLKTTSYADTIYTYTGNSWDYLDGTATNPPYTNITGSFTVATALSPNTSYDLTLAPPTSYSFTDGVDIWSSANSILQDFLLITDASGNIAAWAIISSSAYYPHMITSAYTSWGTEDQIQTVADRGGAEVQNNPGSWTIESSPTPPTVPEPCTMFLLGSGLIGLAGLRRKFKN